MRRAFEQPAGYLPELTIDRCALGGNTRSACQRVNVLKRKMPEEDPELAGANVGLFYLRPSFLFEAPTKGTLEL